MGGMPFRRFARPHGYGVLWLRQLEVDNDSPAQQLWQSATNGLVWTTENDDDDDAIVSLSCSDTAKFYMALSAVGTDFTMINAMFPKRTRQQIKNKFKREERLNRIALDKAISKFQCPMSLVWLKRVGDFF